MGTVGDRVRVIASSGFHSKQYVGRTGRSVMKLSATGRTQWVVRFSSSLTGDEEGLYEEFELEWLE